VGKGRLSKDNKNTSGEADVKVWPKRGGSNLWHSKNQITLIFDLEGHGGGGTKN